MMGIGVRLLEAVAPLMETIAPYLPGETFPFFFTIAMFQRALLAAFVISIVAGVLGSFLLIRNMSLIGDGIAHVSFGGVAVALVMVTMAKTRAATRAIIAPLPVLSSAE